MPKASLVWADWTVEDMPGFGLSRQDKICRVICREFRALIQQGDSAAKSCAKLARGCHKYSQEGGWWNETSS